MKLPVVLTRHEVKEIFRHLGGTPKLMAMLLYGSGLRLMECVRLRVKDVDFGYAQITVRDAKGGKDRVTMLPIHLAEPLQRHLVKVKAQHEQDLEDGTDVSICPTRWNGSFPTRIVNGPGSTFSRQPGCHRIRGREGNSGTIRPKAFFKSRLSAVCG